MSKYIRIAKWTAASLGAAAAIVLMLAWLAGAFKPKIPLDRPGPAVLEPVGDRPVVAVAATTRPYVEWAVGTTKPVHETTLGSRLLAKVIAVHVRAGIAVAKNDLLIELDDADLRAQVEQAQAVLAAASAAEDQARIEFNRVRDLIAKNAASPLEMDRVTNALRGAEADRQRAERALAESRTRLSFARVVSPMDGRVIDKRVDVGDTVTPGQPLVTLYDDKRMQMVAVVRESLAERLRVGQTVAVRLEALDKECEGRVEEIVPQAQAASRAFEVKVGGPCPPGVYPGMFGRIRIPLDPQPVTHIPAAAVHQIGQLNLVDVVIDGAVARRLVRLGRAFDDQVEILAGLTPGEKVALPRADRHAQ